jgi:propionyl-CoA synthetase
VLIYMPMIAEAVFAMLACARIGAIHSVVFGGFASVSLASRIEDAGPRSSSAPTPARAAARSWRTSRCWTRRSASPRTSRGAVLLADRGLAPMDRVAGRDHDWADAAREAPARHRGACTWLDATDISYTIYTSGTTGRPKGVQRDVGGYAVALAASMKHIFLGEPARPTSPPATSAGWWATATSSTGR